MIKSSRCCTPVPWGVDEGMRAVLHRNVRFRDDSQNAYGEELHTHLLNVAYTPDKCPRCISNATVFAVCPPFTLEMALMRFSGVHCVPHAIRQACDCPHLRGNVGRAGPVSIEPVVARAALIPANVLRITCGAFLETFAAIGVLHCWARSTRHSSAWRRAYDAVGAGVGAAQKSVPTTNPVTEDRLGSVPWSSV